MNIKQEYKNYTQGLVLLIKLIIDPLYLAFQSLREVYKISYKKGIIITLFAIGALSLIFSTLYLATLPSDGRYIEGTQKHEKLKQFKIESDFQHTHIGNLEQITSSQPSTVFIVTYSKTVEILRPILDGFIGSTPDVTGITSPGGKVEFINGSSIMSASKVYSKSIVVAVGIFTLLLVANGLHFMLNSDYASIRELVSRIILVGFLLISGRYLMSISIQLTNSINNTFRDGASLSDYLIQFATSVQAGLQGSSNSNSFINNFRNILDFATGNVITYVQAIPVILPLLLILLFLLFLSFQFIGRFITLYFLVPIQPLASVFALHPKTKHIHENFWKTWFTLLIHQPFFVLGYAIVQNILLNMLVDGPNLTSVIIFLSALIFLSSLNILVSKIFGDMWVAVHQNIQAGLGVGLLNWANNASHKVMNSMPGQNSSPSSDIETNSQDTTEKENNEESKLNTKEIFETPVMHSLKREGHAVNLKDDELGYLNVTGSFFAAPRSDGISVLYSSRDEAIQQGENQDTIRSVQLHNFELLDSSNSRGAHVFNNQNDNEDSHLNTTRPARSQNIMHALKSSNHGKSTSIKGIAVDPEYGRDPRDTQSVQLFVQDKYLS